MENIIELISRPWHWFPSGVGIALVMLFLILLGQKFGVSSSFRALCTVGGAGRFIDYFKYDWKSHDWLLVFVIGSMLGGYLAINFLYEGGHSAVNVDTILALKEIGVDIQADRGVGFLPYDIFNFENLKTLSGFIMIIGGGFLIGFGTRWANGCTSGHAISGLSSFQLPSLVAVIGFFIGGLLMTHLLLPIILSL